MHFMNSTNIKLVLDNYTDLYRDMPNCRYIEMFKLYAETNYQTLNLPICSPWGSVPMPVCSPCLMSMLLGYTWSCCLVLSVIPSENFLVEGFILNIVVTIHHCVVCIFYILTLLCGLQLLWLIEFEKHIRINLHHQWCFSQVIFLKLYYYYIFSPMNSNDFAVTSIMSSVLISILYFNMQGILIVSHDFFFDVYTSDKVFVCWTISPVLVTFRWISVWGTWVLTSCYYDLMESLHSKWLQSFCPQELVCNSFVSCLAFCCHAYS